MTCTYCDKSEQEVSQLLKAPRAALCNECIERGMVAIVSKKAEQPKSKEQAAGVVCAMCTRHAGEVTRILVIHGQNLCSSCLFSSFDILLSHKNAEGKIIKVD